MHLWLGHTELAIEDSRFFGGFVSTAMTQFVRGNVFGDPSDAARSACRTNYDPAIGGIHELNVVYGHECKTVDFFHPDTLFRYNIVYSGTATDQATGDVHFVGNLFGGGSAVGGFAYNSEYRDNIVQDFVPSGRAFSGTGPDSQSYAMGKSNTGNLVVNNKVFNSGANGFIIFDGSGRHTDNVAGTILGAQYGHDGKAFWFTGVRQSEILRNRVRNAALAYRLTGVSDSLFGENAAREVAVGVRLENCANLVLRDTVFGAISQYEFDISGSTGITIRDQPMPVRVNAPAGQVIRFDWTNLSPSSSYTLMVGGQSLSFSTDGSGAGGVMVTMPGGTVQVDLAGSIPARNIPPVVDFDPPLYRPGAEPRTGVAITFDGSESFDPDGSIVDWLWDFGEGTTARGQQVSKTYSTGGAYYVTLTVTDNQGAKSSRKQIIFVLPLSEGVPPPPTPVPPIAAFTYSPTSPRAGQTVTFDAGSSSGYGLTYAWDMGDGTVGAGAQVQKVYGAAGSYKVTLTVRDAAGQMDSIVRIVNVGEAPPGTSR